MVKTEIFTPSNGDKSIVIDCEGLGMHGSFSGTGRVSLWIRPTLDEARQLQIVLARHIETLESHESGD